MSNADSEIDWSLTTWEGSRREQLRRWRKLSLRERLRAVEDMADTSRHFQAMRAQGRFQSPARHAEKSKVEAARQGEVREPDHVYESGSPQHEITLYGCTPEPLMGYLKALGMLRLVSEQQADPLAKGFWRNNEFVLQSRLDANELIDFFMTRYEPTPIFSPWNGDGGFLSDSGAAYETIEKIKSLETKRLARMQRFIDDLRSTASLNQLGAARAESKTLQDQYNEKYKTKADKWKKKATEREKEEYATITKKIKSIKQSLIFMLRNEYPNESLAWLDSCLAINKDEIAMSPVLGSGGVDGRMEFSANYLANVIEIVSNDNSSTWLKKSLLGDGSPALVNTSVGQFAPGAVGGANATQGMEGDSIVNPWDYVLMIEGVVLLAGSVSRKLGINQSPRAVFPFTVYSQAAGESSLGQKESKEARGEIWLPLWARPAGIGEIQQVLSEGRAELRAKQSYSAVDFARAVAGLGIDRGILSFSRQGFLKRNGLAFIATPLGRFDVHARAQVDLLRGIDRWLDKFRSACKVGQKGEAPSRITAALHGIDSAIFDYCRYGGRRQFQAILIELGRAERELMRDGRWAEKNSVRPLHGLSADWIDASRDASLEFKLALALAGIRSNGEIGPLRANLEPVHVGLRKDGGTYANWAEKGRAVVWNQSSLTANLTAVLTRRIQDAARQGRSRLPLWSPYTVSLETVAAYLAGQTDDKRLEELLWGLVLIDPGGSRSGAKAAVQEMQNAPPLSRLYALLKLLFLHGPIVYRERHWRFASKEEVIIIRPEPRILPLLRAGQIDQTARIATQRLRASGLQPMVTRDEKTWPEEQGRRLASALLFPIDSYSLDRLLRSVVREDSTAIQLQGEVA